LTALPKNVLPSTGLLDENSKSSLGGILVV